MVVLMSSLSLDVYQIVKQDAIKDVQLIILIDIRDITVIIFV